MAERKIKFPEDPNQQSAYLKCAEKLLDSHSTTLSCIDAHQSGNVDGLGERGFGFSVAYTVYNNIYTEPFRPKGYKGKAESIQQSWREIRKPHLEKLLIDNPKYQYTGSRDPMKFFLKFWKDPERYGFTGSELIDLFDRSCTLAVQDPQALPLLQSQLEVEEKLLETMVPLWRETSEDEYRGTFWHYEREPRDIDQAVDIVNGSHYYTELTKEYYETNGRSLRYGGFGTLYALFKQDGYFASLFTPEQLMSAKDYMDRWRYLRIHSYRLALRKFDNVAIDDTDDPFKIIDNWFPTAQDIIADKAHDILKNDLDTVGLINSQSGYEVSLLEHIHKLKQGNGLPLPETPGQAVKLLEACHKWTQINLDTVKNHTWGGWIGGFRRYYDLLAQDTSLSHLLPEQLIGEGRELCDKYKLLRENCLKRAIIKNWGVDIGLLNPEIFMQGIGSASVNFSQSDYFIVRKRELGDMLHNPEVVTHLENQAEYEERALKYLSTI
jgi:hypothetical protein